MANALFIKIFGDVGESDRAIEAEVEKAIGASFDDLGCTVFAHVHPRRSSRAKYTHMLKLSFRGSAEKATFANKWTVHDAETRKTRTTLRVKECATQVGEPLPPHLQKMLSELIAKKNDLAATMNVDGDKFKFDLSKGTIKDEAGELLYTSSQGN